MTVVVEFARTFARTDGRLGAISLYTSMLADGHAVKSLAAQCPVTLPALAIGGLGGAFASDTLHQVVAGDVESVQLDGVGHYVALKYLSAFADAVLAFTGRVDGSSLPTAEVPVVHVISRGVGLELVCTCAAAISTRRSAHSG